MSQLVIRDIEEAILEQLRQRAATHGRSAEVEAKKILEESLQLWRAAQWGNVNTLRGDLSATGQTFSDSTTLIREDRDR